jgi:hypothetical protein
MKIEKSLLIYFLKGLCTGVIIMLVCSLILPPALPIFAGGLFTITFIVDMNNKKGIRISNGVLLLFTILFCAILSTILLKAYCVINLPSTACKPSFLRAVQLVNFTFPTSIAIFNLILLLIKNALEKIIAKR